MTLVMLTRVADNFAAASRTLFSFMKDANKAETSNVGFIHYIRNNGPYDWPWLTIDYLWDYFFLTGSDIRELGTEARRAYQLYEQKKDLVMGDDGTDYVLRVFKAALLLIAVMATDKKVFYSNRRRSVAKAEATRNTVRKCFVGLLSQDKVDECLQSLYNSNILFPVETLDRKDYRIELPYGKNVEKFDTRLEQIRKDYTRNILFKKGGTFSKYIEDMLWPKDADATYNRMSIAVCSEETNSLKTRFEEVRSEIEKEKYKLGLLCVVLSDSSHLAEAEQKVKTRIQEYPTERMSFCILKKPFTEEELEDWYRVKTHCELAREEGKTNQYDEQMGQILNIWTAEALEDTISFYYQDKVYQSVYGKNDLKSRIREHILFHVFEAAPERIVELQTVYRKAQESFALAGVARNDSPKLRLNAQMTNIADNLKRANVWECESIEQLEQTTGTPAANAVAMLARKIHENMTQGAKIKLDDLWEELQAPPFGYYNASVCAYLLGFVLRFWKDSEFNWVDNESNSFDLTDQYLAKMVQFICTDKATNHTLSSGSEIWHSFKEYLRTIFGFKENEIPNEQKARYSLCAKITSYGVPLWALKYIDAESVGGEASKKICDDALDGFFAFMQNRPEDDQEKNMDKVVQTFKGKGRLKKNLQEVLNRPNSRYKAFKEFIWKNSAEMKELAIQLKLTDNDLFDSIKKLMQANIETWTEKQVIVKLPDLCREYQIIRVLNFATGKEEKSLFQHVEMLRNCFSNMKVPGSVIEEMGYSWADALSAMYLLTRTLWQSIPIDKKEEMIAVISKNGREAWQNVCSSKILMAAYIKSFGMECSETDLEQVYQKVQEWNYDTKIPVYKEHIKRPLEDIKNERNKKALSKEWCLQTGFKTVEDWCKHYNVPIQWIIKKEALTYIECIHKVATKKPVVPLEVYNALRYLQSTDLSYLKNEKEIDNKFFEEVGEQYREYFVEYKNEILTRIRIECGATVYDWPKQGNRMIRVIQRYVNIVCEKKLKAKAIHAVKTLDEQKLRATILGLIEEQPELCRYFA